VVPRPAAEADVSGDRGAAAKWRPRLGVDGESALHTCRSSIADVLVEQVTVEGPNRAEQAASEVTLQLGDAAHGLEAETRPGDTEGPAYPVRRDHSPRGCVEASAEILDARVHAAGHAPDRKRHRIRLPETSRDLRLRQTELNAGDAFVHPDRMRRSRIGRGHHDQ